jgi:hypothetical protein
MVSFLANIQQLRASQMLMIFYFFRLVVLHTNGVTCTLKLMWVTPVSHVTSLKQLFVNCL